MHVRGIAVAAFTRTLQSKRRLHTPHLFPQQIDTRRSNRLCVMLWHTCLRMSVGVDVSRLCNDSCGTAAAHCGTGAALTMSAEVMSSVEP